MPQINTDELFMDTVYADITFVVDKEAIPGHRVVLAKICDYFNKLLFGDFLESKSKEVVITGMSAKVFKEVLRFVYKGKLEVEEWTIEDLISLLAVAHEYHFRPLFSAVIKAFDGKPLDFDSWALVKSAASVYGSEELKRKYNSFAEDKIEDFVRGKDLQKFSADLICCMFDVPRMSSFNQDHVVKAICNWKKGQSSADIMSVIQKINWENVSSKYTAIVIKDFFSTVKNVEEHKFWTKLSADIEGPLESDVLSDCIIRVDSVVLQKDIEKKFVLPQNKGKLFGCMGYDSLQFWFQKNESRVEIPVKRMAFEASTKFNIESFVVYDSKLRTSNMVISEVTANNSWYKYRAAFSDAKPMYFMCINSKSFKSMAEIRLQNIIIY